MSPSLKELSWLPINEINEMLQRKDIAMIYKFLHGLAPNYLETNKSSTPPSIAKTPGN